MSRIRLCSSSCGTAGWTSDQPWGKNICQVLNSAHKNKKTFSKEALRNVKSEASFQIKRPEQERKALENQWTQQRTEFKHFISLVLNFLQMTTEFGTNSNEKGNGPLHVHRLATAGSEPIKDNVFFHSDYSVTRNRLFFIHGKFVFFF